MNEQDKLDEQYLQAQLREELGEPVDLSDRVLHEYFAGHAPAPRKPAPVPPGNSYWKSLAAAAVVLIATGVVAFALVTWLPELQQQTETRDARDDRELREQEPQPKDTVRTHPAPSNDETRPEPEAQEPPAEEPWPDLPPEEPGPEPGIQPEEQPEEQVEEPTPEPESEPEQPGTDEPDSPEVPGPVVEPPPEIPDKYPETGPTARVLVCNEVKASRKGGVKVQRNGVGDWLVHEGDFVLRSGDRIKVRGYADFSLVDGTLIRVDGDMVITKADEQLSVELEDGALYADTANPLNVSFEGLVVTVDGMAALEQRLHALDVFCVDGQVRGTEYALTGGQAARFDDEGFGRVDEIDWQEVQREFRFLADSPARVRLRQDYDFALEEVFGGEIINGRLKGKADAETGIGHYLAYPVEATEHDVVRVRFKLDKACELVLQFGTVEDANWRHELGTVKGGEWIEFELPLHKLVKTTDNEQKFEPGMELKFFQLHPNETTTGIEIDWIEILHRP